jgi:hypothetical protein
MRKQGSGYWAAAQDAPRARNLEESANLSLDESTLPGSNGPFLDGSGRPTDACCATRFTAEVAAWRREDKGTSLVAEEFGLDELIRNIAKRSPVTASIRISRGPRLPFRSARTA